MSFRWVFEDASGERLERDVVPAQGFPTQADAETWIGESWRDLLDGGVEQVRLYQDDSELYGPMSLRPAQ